MHAIQFNSIVQGNTIQIPEEYLYLFRSGTQVRVIADDSLMGMHKHHTRLTENDFVGLRIDTSSWKFNR
jgi:hypothetical protein